MITCPECEGEGVIPKEITHWKHVCGGDDRLCARRCPEPEPDIEYEPCYMCGGAGLLTEEEIE